MASSLTASLLLLSVVFMQFVSAADQNNSTIKALPGENLFLPCKDPDQGEIRVVDWSRTDLGSGSVLLYKDNQLDPDAQHPSYKNRADLLLNQLRKGDASLILKNTNTHDSRTYECRIYTEKHVDKLISTVSLQVSPPPLPPEPFPVWAKALLVLLVLFAPVLILWLWYRFSVHQVKVESGVESVLLPWRWGDQLVSCRSTACLPGDVRVEWRDDRDRKVHVYQNGSDCSAEQNQRYRTRTKMDKNFSLTLKQPTYKDNGIYTCSVYRDGDKLMKKVVWLKVKVQQVEVESGVESVLLSWTITESLDGDVRVEWMDGYNTMVHVYQNGSDRPDEQNTSYEGRTKMDENLLKTKDLSLTLMDPTYSDTFTCRVSRDGTVLMMKQVLLKVKDHQVEAEEGAESVKLPFRVTFDLQEGDGVKLWWWDNEERMVHVEQIGSDQPVEQALIYRTRTRMNKDALETKDLSLTLMKPTERDGRWFRCGVYRNGELLRLKTFQLNIKAGTDQDQPEDTRKPLMADQSDQVDHL